MERHLRAAVDFFGADAPLATLTPEDFGRWVHHLRDRGNGHGGVLAMGACGSP
ncbi:MAG: hypothetical protein RLN75_07185 [Longimicrobiales bacterium]